MTQQDSTTIFLLEQLKIRLDDLNDHKSRILVSLITEQDQDTIQLLNERMTCLEEGIEWTVNRIKEVNPNS